VGVKLNAGEGASFGGSVTSIVLLIVSVPPSWSSTSSVTVWGPPDVNDVDAVGPVSS
jgi:hypothetical protein